MSIEFRSLLGRNEKSTFTQFIAVHKIKKTQYVVASIKPSNFTFSSHLCISAQREKNCTITRNFITKCTWANEYIKGNRLFHNTHISKKTASISNKMTSSLNTLPVELVYRILDHLNEVTILLSCSNVCTRLNTIIDTYHRYQVLFNFIIKSYFHYVWNILFFLNVLFSFKLSIPDTNG
jgi:hypothetical protein